MKLILPVILLFLGIGGGVGAGIFLAPTAPEPAETALENACGPGHSPEQAAASSAPTPAASGEDSKDGKDSKDSDYARLNNQFVVPVVSDGRVRSLVVVSLSVEVSSGKQDIVFEREPKLRDAFLQVLFEHANLGGFDGNFTSVSNMRSLRDALRGAARESVGPDATDVLILEMVRQDV